MASIDINCDMGEGMATDSLIMPYVTSANIACGYHAGGEAIIKQTIDLCLQHGVKIGAHPSFKDKENFGRKELPLSLDEIYALIIQQLVKIDLIAKQKGTKVHHVKPHGALYNLSAKDAAIAKTIATAVKDFDESLVLYGLSGSYSIWEAKAIGLHTASEVFADRTYQDDGSLTPRSHQDALIQNVDEAVQQVMQMINEKTITTVSGKQIPIEAETVCIHGDSKGAAFLAKALFSTFLKHQDAINN
jgi:5-oxoprolinase (ATP-hydrolysing) subunit A